MNQHKQADRLIAAGFSEETAYWLTEPQAPHLQYLAQLRRNLEGKVKRRHTKQLIQHRQSNPLRR